METTKKESKHHFRKVYKSDYLCSADLEDLIEQKKSLQFTIKEVKQCYDISINGKKGNHNIAYFVEPIKPLVLNAGNARILRAFHPENSPMVEDWKNVKIELYIEQNVKFGKDVTTGVRISPVQPREKVKPSFTEANFEKAYLAKATIELIEKNYSITEDIKTKYNEFVKSKTDATGQ
jgi:hypothetical protein